MIHVEPQPEPLDFDRKVRQPSRQALASKATPLPPHWRKCLGQLWEDYGGICAYLAVRIPPGAGGQTVEHLAPRKKRPDLAYEWSNFRLVCSLMNARKGVFEDVLDPFEVKDGWFVLELSSLEVLPHGGLPAPLREAVQKTIERLRLNDAECIKARAEHYDAYLEHGKDRSFGIPFRQLQRWNPFVAKELLRQGLVAEAP